MRKFLFYLIQWTYALPQNLIGLTLFLYFRLKYHCPAERFRFAIWTGWPRKDGVSLGTFIFTGKADSEALKKHEYGHSLQSLILGPLYLPVIGLPSILWANAKRLARKWQSGQKDYYEFYPEKWANRLGKTHISTNGKEQENESETV